MRSFEVLLFNRFTKQQACIQREARSKGELRRRLTLALARGWFVKLITEVTV